MGLGNIVVLAQVTIFLISFILSFFMFVPMSVNLNQFQGHCLLYGESEINSRNFTDLASGKLTIVWGHASNCNYGVFMGVIMMLLSLVYVVQLSVYLYTERDTSWLLTFLTLVVCGVMSLMQFVAAIIISDGFAAFCDAITQPNGPAVQCEDADFEQIAPSIKFSTEGFYTQYGMAQFACWSTWLCWLTLSILALYKVYKHNQQEAFLTSMNRERERLVQRVRAPQRYEDI